MKIKRILSAFLAGAVVLGSMAIPAFADDATKYVAQLGKAKYEFVQQAVTAAADGDVITIIADINNNGAVATVANKTVAIDLNGKTVSATSNTGVFCATTGGNLTIVGSGKVIAKEKSDHYAMAVYAKGGTVNIRSGNYGQSVNGTETQYDLIYAAEGGTINISGGNFESVTPRWTLNVQNGSTSKMNVIGGTFKSYDPAKSDTEEIVGETSNFVVDGYESVANDDGTCTVKAAKAIAKVGETGYATLQEAVTAAANSTTDKTVKLLEDAAGDGVVVEKDKTVTIDFDNYTYTVNGLLVGSGSSKTNGFQLLKGSNVTMINGKIVVSDDSIRGDNFRYSPYMIIQNYSNLTMENMTAEGGNKTWYILSSNYGDTVLKNVNFSAEYENVCAIDLMHWEKSYNDYPPTIVIDNEDTNVIKGSIKVYCQLDDDETVVENKNCIPRLAIKGGTFSADVNKYIIGNRKVTDNQDGTYTVEFAGKTIAMIDNTGYTSLQAAVDAASATDTIVLESDIYEPADSAATVNGKTVTINLNNHNVKASGYDGVFYVGKDGKLTINGEGTVTALEYKKYAMATWANNGGEITIDGGTFVNDIKGTSDHYDLIYVSGKGITNVNGGKFTNQTSKWTLNLNDNSGSVIKVKGGTFTDYDPANSKTEPKTVTNFVENGYASVANGDGTYSVELREEGFGKVAVLTKGLDDKGNALLVLFTGINYLDYKNAGFKVNFADEEKELPTTTVYTKVNADKEYTAEEFGGKYILGVELKLGTQYAGKSFTITPFANVINKDNEVVSAAKATTVGVYSEGNSDNTQGATP